MEDVDLLYFLPSVPLLIVSHVVMLDWFIKYTFVHKGGIPALRPNHEGADVCHAHLESEQHQIGLEADIFPPWENFVLWNPDVRFCDSFLLLGDPNFYVTDHLHKLAEGLPIIGPKFPRKALGVGQHERGDITEMRLKIIGFEESIVELLGILNGGRNLIRTIPRDIIKIDGLLGGSESVTADLESLEYCGVADVIPNDLIETATVGIAPSFFGGLLGRYTGKVAGRSLSVDVLSVLERPLHSGDESDVVRMLTQGLHRRTEFQRGDAVLVFNTLLLLGLVCIEASNKSGELGLLLTGEESAPVDAVGDVEHDHLLVRLFLLLERLGGGQRRHEGESQECALTS